MALLPVLSLFDVFGESWTTDHAANAQIQMRVEYPTAMRAHVSRPLMVSVKNISSEPLTIEVAFDPAYVAQFASSAFTPPPHDSYVVEFSEVQPGQSRHAHLELEGEIVGRHPGWVVAEASGLRVGLIIHTSVFP